MISGMVISTVVTLLFTPVYYSVLDSLSERMKKPLQMRRARKTENCWPDCGGGKSASWESEAISLFQKEFCKKKVRPSNFVGDGTFYLRFITFNRMWRHPALARCWSQRKYVENRLFYCKPVVFNCNFGSQLNHCWS